MELSIFQAYPFPFTWSFLVGCGHHCPAVLNVQVGEVQAVHDVVVRLGETRVGGGPVDHDIVTGSGGRGDSARVKAPGSVLALGMILLLDRAPAAAVSQARLLGGAVESAVQAIGEGYILTSALKQRPYTLKGLVETQLLKSTELCNVSSSYLGIGGGSQKAGQEN